MAKRQLIHGLGCVSSARLASRQRALPHPHVSLGCAQQNARAPLRAGHRQSVAQVSDALPRCPQFQRRHEANGWTARTRCVGWRGALGRRPQIPARTSTAALRGPGRHPRRAGSALPSHQLRQSRAIHGAFAFNGLAIDGGSAPPRTFSSHAERDKPRFGATLCSR